MYYLAFKHIFYYRAQSLMMIAGLTLVLAFPVVVWRTAGVAEDVYMSRARATPLVVGRRASAQPLTLNTLYFEGPKPPTVPFKLVKELREKKAGLVLPVSNRFTAGGFALIGTVPEYFEFRRLELVDGELPLLLGDCVVGAAVARKLGLKAGGFLCSDIASFLNVAHEYPFKLTVTGVLKANGTADDRAVFVDLKTIWTVEGLGHGHDNVVENTTNSLGSAPTPEVVNAQVQNILGKGVTEYREVTAANIKSFHFHGDEKEYPISAVIIAPLDEKHGTMLKAAVNTGEEYEAVVPEEVVSGLMRLVFNVKKVFDGYFAMTALGVVSFLVIIISLNLRNRRDEFLTMARMGCSRYAVFAVFAWELGILFAVSGVLSLGISEAALVVLRGMVF